MFENIIMQEARRICDRINLNILCDKIVLVTGASGLIGTHILACLCHLQEQGTNMNVYVHHFSKLPPHVAKLVIQSDFKVIQANLADFDEYACLPEADIILHAAGYAQPTRFMADPIATIQVNTSATIALLKRLRSGGKFLFISSSEIYSGLNKPFLNEADIGSTVPSHPRAAYIESKRCGEAICNAFRAQGVRAVIARVALAYGPGTRKHDKRVLNSFIEKALCHQRIELLDAGVAVRTYGYVDDIVELLWQVLLYGKETVYNVGGKSTLTIAELAKMIGEMTNATVVLPATQAEITGAPEQVSLDLTRVETEFGKRDYICMKDGLRATIEWQRSLYVQVSGGCRRAREPAVIPTKNSLK